MKTSRTFRRLLIFVGLIALFSLIGFVVLPPIVKSQLETRLSAELGRRVTVEKVRLNPYALSLTLDNVAIREAKSDAVFLSWLRLYVNFDALSSLRGEWTLSEIALDGFQSKLGVNADGSLNISDILAKLAPPNAAPPKNKPSRPIRVVSLKASEARVEFSDASRKQPFATKIGPVTFALTEFRTTGTRGAPYRFEAVTESGEKLTWLGTIQAEPFLSVGELTLENIVLPKYAPYYAELTQVDLLDGKLTLRGRYELNLSTNQRAMKLTEGAVQLRDLKLAERMNQQLAADLPSLDVVGIQADALASKLAVDAVTVSGGKVRVRREKDGTLNLLAMLKPAAAPPPSPQTPAPPASGNPPAPAVPDVRLGELALNNVQVEIADLAAPRPVQLALNDLQLSLKNITLAENARMPLQLGFNWAPRGALRIEGDVGISPVLAEVKTTLADFELLPLSPYLEQFANIHLTQGAVSATLAAQVSLPANGNPAIAAAGDVTIEKLGLVDGAHNEELAGFATLALRGLRASTTPELSVALEEINLAGPYARIVVNADKTVNLAAVATPAAAPANATPPAPVTVSTTPPAAAPPPPKITIGKVIIQDGDYRFTDRSVQPAVTMAMNQFGGTIAGLSSATVGKADVDLKAMIDGAGPVAITGKLDPLSAAKHVDLKVDFKNVDLVPLSPYAGKFAGFELARGKLQLDVKLLVEGKKIDSANVVTLQQFTFGNPVQSPDATSLPVRLGVALLKDSDGKIVIDMPVQGSTDDPSFRVGRVVLRVVTNLLTKAATSPFALLGAAFGGGGDELSYQEFAPGSAELQPAERAKLDTLVKALVNRPALNVALEGTFDPAADAYALKRAKLSGAIRRTVWESKRQVNPNIAPPEQLAVTAEDSAAAIRKMFDEKFPPGTQFGAPLPQPPPVVAIPVPPAPGMWRRVWNTVSFQQQQDRRALEAELARKATDQARAMTVESAPGLPIEEMNGRLAEAITVSDDDLRSLARARAQNVRDYLSTTGKISPERLFLASDSTSGAATTAAGKGPRVVLTLQ